MKQQLEQAAAQEASQEQPVASCAPMQMAPADAMQASSSSSADVEVTDGRTHSEHNSPKGSTVEDGHALAERDL